jgi:hypothetical protein
MVPQMAKEYPRILACLLLSVESPIFCESVGMLEQEK